MPSQFIYWPITFPDENPNSPKPDQINLNSVHLPPPPPPPPRTRSRKSAKQVTPKRAPQRGLGVAQLERLRMEQAGETDLLMHQPRRVMLPHMLVGSYPSPVGSGGGLLTGTYPVGSMGPPGYMGRYLATPAQEPPSTQMVPRPLMPPPVDPVQCYADQCEFCVRKKRLFGESSVYEYVDGGNQMEMDLTATITPSGDLEGGMMRCMERRKETREYQFFPTYGGSLAELAFPMMSDASTSAPSRSAYPSQPIDLSLKLSY